MIAALQTGCTKPEIAVVLEDYCEFHKGCGYKTVTQFDHSLAACDRFHKDLLNEAADGQPSGCSDDVEQFFIDFMHAQMDEGCDADLMQSLNASPVTQKQLSTMVECAQGGSNSSSNSVAGMGLHIVESLQLDVNHMSPDVCATIIGAIMPDQKERIQTICGFDLSAMTVDGCNSLLVMLKDNGQLSMEDATRERICALFTHADVAG